MVEIPNQRQGRALHHRVHRSTTSAFLGNQINGVLYTLARDIITCISRLGVLETQGGAHIVSRSQRALHLGNTCTVPICLECIQLKLKFSKNFFNYDERAAWNANG